MKPISLEKLVYHTSGIRDYMVLMWLTGKSFEDAFSNADVMDIILIQWFCAGFGKGVRSGI